jgi:hypothetical protein
MLFDLADFAPPAPDWAVACFYCLPDDSGHYDRERHDHAHLALTCDVCGKTSPNRPLFEQSHDVNLGASWEHGWLLCTGLSLALNHLRYDLLHGDVPLDADKYALELGWLIAPDGEPIAPEGWPEAPPSDPYPGRQYFVRASANSGQAEQ